MSPVIKVKVTTPSGPGPKGDPGQQGLPGQPGNAATVSVGTVTTGAPDSSATVTNVGTSSNAVLNFSIPRGHDGDGAGVVVSVVAGDNITVDSSDPANPIVSSTASGGASFKTANDNGEMQALSTEDATFVYRLGHNTAGDSPALLYLKSDDPCDLNGGAGDGASQIPSADGKSWRAQFGPNGADIRQFAAFDNTGGTDVYVAIQLAINAMARIGGTVFIPSGKWLVNTPLNMANINNVKIKGTVSQFQSFGLLLALPSTGSVIVGNTNGKEIFSCLGSNNLFFEDFTVGSLGAAQPSKVGFLYGPSGDTHAGQPGGANYYMRNVSIQMQTAMDSIPIYLNNGAGICTWDNVSTSGDYGFCITSGNDRSITPTYGTYYGTLIGTGAVTMRNCTSLGSGTRPILYLKTVYNFVADNFYSVLPGPTSGPSFTGQQYPISITDSHNIKIFVENDYWPSLLVTNGDIDNIEVKGLTFPNTTPLATTTPLVAAFLGTSLTNSKFDVSVTGAAPSGTHYWYVTSGSNPATIVGCYGNRFTYNSNISSSVGFFNVTNGFFNNYFDGTNATVSFSLLQNASALPAANQRYFLNGVRQGTL